MRRIIGLMLKDILQIKFYKRNLFISIILYLVFMVAQLLQGNFSSLGAVLIIMLFNMVIVSTFNYDEKTKADTFIPTFPISRKEIVFSKYILSIILLFIGSLVGFIISLLLSFIITSKIPNISELLFYILVAIIILSCLNSVQIPCIYKWGVERGRSQVYIITMGFSLVAIIIYFILPVKPNINDLLNMSFYFPIVGFIITILIYYISYRVSYLIYKKKEL